MIPISNFQVKKSSMRVMTPPASENKGTTSIREHIRIIPPGDAVERVQQVTEFNLIPGSVARARQIDATSVNELKW